jgi:hypothetical protein
MISMLMFFLPLVAQTETLTLTSGLEIEARYLPEQDAFILSLEAFGALVADLELAGPSCTKRIDAVKAECQGAMSDALKRAEARQVNLYDQWVKDQATLTDMNARLLDVNNERIMWRWVAFGTGMVALCASSFIILTY